MSSAQSKIKPTYWLEKFGQAVINNGYLIHPVRPESKGIFEEGWQDVRADATQLEKWLAENKKAYGISLLTGFGLVAVDIDTKNEQCAQALVDFCVSRFGQPLIRYGNHPKCLLVYRCDQRLTKMRSKTFVCWQGMEHAVEILAVGQQFVAYNIHPNTGKPYTWANKKAPHNTPLSEIQGRVDKDGLDSVIDYAETLFRDDEGMEIKPGAAGGGTRGSLLGDGYEGDEDAKALAAMKPRYDLSRNQVKDYLLAIRDTHAEDYDSWLKVGMALHHQFHGNADGLKAWHIWSRKSEKYDEDALDKKWRGFSADESLRREPVTFGYVMAEAKRLQESQRQEQASELLPELKEVAEAIVDEDTFRTAVSDLQKKAKQLDQVSLKILQNVLHSSAKAAGVPVSLSDVRNMLKGSKRATVEAVTIAPSEIFRKHPWAEGMYWIADRDMFASARWGMLSVTSVRAMFSRNFLDIDDEERLSYVTQERFAAKVDDPAWFLMNVCKVPSVHAVSYAPGSPGVFSIDGISYVNSFRPWFEHQPDGSVEFLEDITLEHDWTPRQQQAVERFKRLSLSVAGGKGHELEAAILTSWVAARYQNPAQKNQWSPFLWGPKGSGKSSYGNALMAVFSSRHAIMVSTSEISSMFSGYAGQACLAVVDEADLSTHKNREEIATRLRPHITSSRVVRVEKGRDGRNVPNYQDYIFMGNNPEGIPVDEGERRFLVLKSEFDTREQARKVMIDEGVGDLLRQDYTDPECVSAIRGYLFAYQLHVLYNYGDPIDTDAKRISTEAGRSAIAQEILDMVDDEKIWWANKDYVSVTHLCDEIKLRQERGECLDIDVRTNRNIFYRVLAAEPFNMVRYADRIECGGGGLPSKKYGVSVRNPKKFDPKAFASRTRDELQAEEDGSDDWNQ